MRQLMARHIPQPRWFASKDVSLARAVRAPRHLWCYSVEYLGSARIFCRLHGVRHQGMHVRLATPADAAVVADVLSAAAAKLREAGNELWSTAEVSELAVSRHVDEGLYHPGFLGADRVGGCRLA